MTVTVPHPSPRPEASAADPGRAPILVVGVGRSGTSLLQSMLAAHPDLHLLPETGFHRRYVSGGQAEAWAARGAPALLEELHDDERVQGLAFGPEALLEPWLTAGAELDMRAVYRRLLSLSGTHAGATRVGDKDPRSIEDLPGLGETVPAACVLHLTRDPRDVLLSRTKAAWSAGRPWWSHVLIAREQLRRSRAAGARHYGARYLELRYEDLIADPTAVLQRVCTHIDVAFDPAMLDFGSAAAKLVRPDEMSWKRETLGPLLSANHGKWRKGLSAYQARTTELLCAGPMRSLGYAPETAAGGLSLGEQTKLLGLRVLAPLTPLLYAAARRLLALRR